MQTFLKSTTSLVLCLSLGVPATGWAKNEPKCGRDLDAHDYPCETNAGVVVNSRLEYSQARYEHIRGLHAEAVTMVGVAEGDQIQDQKDIDARAEVERLTGPLEKAERELAEAIELANSRDADAADKKERRAAAERKKARKAEREAAEAEDRAAAKKAERRKAERAAAEDEERRAAKKAERRAQRKAEKQAERDAARDEDRRKKRAERRRARRDAAAAAADADVQADVEQERLRQEDVRASDEEFTEADDGGLSKFEKALLIGLGAVAVGKVLDNGDEVVSNSGDRVVVKRDGELRVLKDDDSLLRQPGNDFKTETFSDGSTRSTVTRPDGSKIVTIRAADGSVLRRSSFSADGQERILFDDTVEETEVIVSDLPQITARPAPAGVISEADLRAALDAEMAQTGDRRFSLRQVREIQQVRALAPEIEFDAVRFATGSAAIQPAQARSLARIGSALSDIIDEDPRTVFLVEGHTDAVGDATYNLSLSDRRAETVALALTEYFEVPPENLITQGYGEGALKVPTIDAEPANRRAVVRNITGLLR